MTDQDHQDQHWSDAAKRIRSLMHDQVGIDLQIGICEQIATELLEDYVPRDQLDEHYQRGIDDTLHRTEAIGPAIQAIEETRALLLRARAWEGPEEWRDETVQSLDETIRHLRGVQQEQESQTS